MIRTNVLRTVLFAVVACQCAEHALGGPFTFTRIADNSTVIPGGTGTFSGFRRFSSAPSIDGEAIAFFGYVNDGQAGVYLSTPTGIEVLADTNAAGAFGPIDADISISGTNVAFTAVDASGAGGIFSVVDGNLSTVVDGSMPVPSVVGPNLVTKFVALGNPSIDGDRVAFMGRVEVRSTLTPNSYSLRNLIFEGGVAGGFVDVQAPGFAFPTGTSTSYDNGQLVYTAGSSADIVLWDGGAQPLNISGLPVIDDGEVAYSLHNTIKLRDTQGGITTLVTRATPIPGGVGNFTSFPNFQLSISEGNIAFAGIGAEGQQGLYTSLGGELDRVIAKGDTLDGSVVSQVYVGDEAISGNALTFSVHFEDGSEAIYRAGVPNFWAMAEDGIFSDDTKWSDGVTPESGEMALFNQQGAYQITFNASVINQAAVVGGGEGPVDLTWNLAGNNYGLGSLTIADTLHAASVRVTGTNSQLHVAGTATVGANGSGVLEIVGGATADLGELRSGTGVSSEAFVSVEGADSTMFVQGDVVLGSGTGAAAVVSQGGSAVVIGDTRLGEAGPFGTVTVTDENSSWSAGGTTLSITGLSSFSVKDGASAEFDFGNLGAGLLEVLGDESFTKFNETLNVGVQDQQAKVNVQAGGKLDVGTLQIVGGAPGLPSEVTIDGAGSKLTVTEIATIGSEGDGVLKVLGGASASLGSLQSGTSNSSSSSVLVQGANTGMLVKGDVLLGLNGSAEVSQGAHVLILGDTRLAESPSTAAVTVKGENSAWLALGTTLSIAPQGQGRGCFVWRTRDSDGSTSATWGWAFSTSRGPDRR